MLLMALLLLLFLLHVLLYGCHTLPLLCLATP
jgi:hypothetical protein